VYAPFSRAFASWSSIWKAVFTSPFLTEICAPHPEQASALMTFILGGTVEKMLARSDSHNGPVQADLAEEFAQYAIDPALRVDYDQVADMLPQAISTAMEILR